MIDLLILIIEAHVQKRLHVRPLGEIKELVVEINGEGTVAAGGVCYGLDLAQDLPSSRIMVIIHEEEARHRLQWRQRLAAMKHGNGPGVFITNQPKEKYLPEVSRMQKGLRVKT